jgi:hypothetical protein
MRMVRIREMACQRRAQSRRRTWQPGQVPCVGAQLGVVVADTWVNARSAAKLVVQAHPLHPGGGGLSTRYQCVTQQRIGVP